MTDSQGPLPPHRASPQQGIIGIEEFTVLQTQLVQEKTAKYEALEQSKRLQTGKERRRKESKGC
jgi:hypothetical protein